MANIYPIPDSLAHHYHGSGIALGTVDEAGNLASLIYVRDIDKDFPNTVEAANNLGGNERVASIARALERDFGHVIVGMVSCWKFCEI